MRRYEKRKKFYRQGNNFKTDKKIMWDWESHKLMLRGIPLKKKQDRFEKDYDDEAEWLKLKEN